MGLMGITIAPPFRRDLFNMAPCDSQNRLALYPRRASSNPFDFPDKLPQTERHDHIDYAYLGAELTRGFCRNLRGKKGRPAEIHKVGVRVQHVKAEDLRPYLCHFLLGYREGFIALQNITPFALLVI
jgi:hypothetical protein